MKNKNMIQLLSATGIFLITLAATSSYAGIVKPLGEKASLCKNGMTANEESRLGHAPFPGVNNVCRLHGARAHFDPTGVILEKDHPGGYCYYHDENRSTICYNMKLHIVAATPVAVNGSSATINNKDVITCGLGKNWQVQNVPGGRFLICDTGGKHLGDDIVEGFKGV